MFKYAMVDGRRIAYAQTTQFLVQVGKGKKGAYKTRYSFSGNLTQALFYFWSINIGNGYKKRLYVPGFNRPVLDRQFS
jgi:hypothetical protein